jgi:hypothetical protein
MQLFLASILSCAAVLVGVLAQTDWKPYSSPEGGLASLSDESRLFTGIASAFDGNPNESLARWTDYQADAHEKATEKTFDRTRYASIRQKETTVMTESSGLLARHKGRGITFTDPTGRTVNVDFDFSEHSFEMLAEGGSKEKLAKAKKFFSTVSAIAERELRKEFVRAQREARSERGQSQRDAHDEILRVDCPESVEAKREPATEYIRLQRSERSDRSNQ